MVKNKVRYEQPFHDIITHVTLFQDLDNQIITMSVQDKIVFGIEKTGYPFWLK